MFCIKKVALNLEERNDTKTHITLFSLRIRKYIKELGR